MHRGADHFSDLDRSMVTLGVKVLHHEVGVTPSGLVTWIGPRWHWV
jgi:hypothetical protein